MSKRYYSHRHSPNDKLTKNTDLRSGSRGSGSRGSGGTNGYTPNPRGMDLPLPNGDAAEGIYHLYSDEPNTYTGSIGRGAHESQNGGSFLSSLLQMMNGKYWSEEELGLFLQAALQQYMTNDQRVWDRTVTNEQRDYDWFLKQDQRNFDSPTNQLARLMGAGISRDAAIQMLSGSSSGAVVGGSAPIVSAAASPGSLPGTPGSFDLQKGLGIASTVFEGINMIAGMVGMGLSIPQSIQQTKSLRMQNTLSQKSLQGLNAADAVLSSLQNAVTSGAISTSDMDGFSNATDALNYIFDHRDTNAFKPIFQSGAFQDVYGTKLGREMFTNAWNSVRQSKDAGTLLDQQIAQSIAASELSHLDIKKGYTDLQYAIGELSRQDVEIQNLWNDVWQGNIQLEILGKELQIKTNEASRSNTEQRIYDTVMNSDRDMYNAPDLRGLGKGAGMIAYSTWSDLYTQFNKAFAMNGTEDRKQSWEKFFLNNNEAAQLLAGVHLTQAQLQNVVVNPELHPNLATLYTMYNIAKYTGAYDVLTLTADKSAAFMPYLLTPNKPR